MCVISHNPLQQPYRACALLAAQTLFPSLVHITEAQVEWCAFNDPTSLKPGAARNSLVIFAEHTFVPSEARVIIEQHQGYAAYATFFGYQLREKKLSVCLGGYNLRFYAHLYADHADRWQATPATPGDYYGTWPEVTFEPGSKAA
jgi:hypothetical protein